MPLTDIPLSSLLEHLPRGVQLETKQTNGKWRWRVKNPAYGDPSWSRSFNSEHEAVSHAIDTCWNE